MLKVLPFCVERHAVSWSTFRGRGKGKREVGSRSNQDSCFVTRCSTLPRSKNPWIYFGKGYQDPWYLRVPSGTSLRAEQIVELYAKRRSIEQGFRDWKTPLGVRGLVFHGDNPAPRLTR